MSTVLQGEVRDEHGAGVGGCRVDAVFTRRVTVETPVLVDPSGNGPVGDGGAGLPPDPDADGHVPDVAHAPQRIDVTDRATSPINDQGRFSLSLPDLEHIVGLVTLTMSGPSAARLHTLAVDARNVDGDIRMTIAAPVPVDVIAAATTISTTHSINGLVVDSACRRPAAHLQVILYGVTTVGIPAHAVGVAITDSSGRFSTDWPNTPFESASAGVATVADMVPVHLQDGRLRQPRATIPPTSASAAVSASTCPTARSRNSTSQIFARSEGQPPEFRQPPASLSPGPTWL